MEGLADPEELERVIRDEYVPHRRQIELSRTSLGCAAHFLVSLEYWSRLWIIQEVCVAKTVNFWLGGRSFDAHMLLALISIWRLLIDGWGDLKISKVLMAACYHFVAFDNSLEKAIYSFGGFACEDKHDIVHALLGMTKSSRASTDVMEVRYQESLENLIARTIDFCRPDCALQLTRELAQLMGLREMKSEQSSLLSEESAPVIISFWPKGYLQPPDGGKLSTPRRVYFADGTYAVSGKMHTSDGVPYDTIFYVDFSFRPERGSRTMAPFTNAISVGRDK